MPYRCEAASVEGFVQYLACNLVNKGYWLYVTGRIPERKDVHAIDRKLIELYGLELSKWARARRKAQGRANVAYIRFERTFILMATQGEHPLFTREAYVRDVRRKPIQFHGYSVGCSRGSDGRYHASVKIQAETFEQIRSYLVGVAASASPERIQTELRRIRYMPYARVRRQFLRILREINDARGTAGMPAIPTSSWQWNRRIVKVFAEDSPAAKTSTKPVADGRTPCDEIILDADAGKSAS